MKIEVDGKEVEVLTAEEAQVKIEEAQTKILEQYKTEHPDQSDAMAKLKEDLDKATEALEAGKGGNPAQIDRLRTERDEAKKNLAEGISALTKKFDDYQAERTNEVQDSLLARFAGNNKELREKIMIEFKNYKPTSVSKADIEERMSKAYQLATGKQAAPGILDGVTGGGARGESFLPTAEIKETANGVAMRKVFGISDEMMKKGQEILKKVK